MRQSPEILAPAGSMEALTAAVHCGADRFTLVQRSFLPDKMPITSMLLHSGKQRISATPTV